MKIGIIGGGVSGTSFLHELVSVGGRELSHEIQIDVYDQGRGLGGRASHRIVEDNENLFRFDHGCQFIRADTRRMQQLVHELVRRGTIREWKGKFESKIFLARELNLISDSFS